MELQQFILQFDYPGSIVLLEGKRDVPEAMQPLLTQLGTLLATQTQHMLFRSGNAAGADEYFSIGVAAVNKQRLQVITPYSGHRKKNNQAYESIPVDSIELAEEPEIIYQSKGNKKTEKLIDNYVQGGRDKFTIKAAYIIRDTVKVVGAKNVAPATFGIFFDDLANPRSGGTGHTMQVCMNKGIPHIDQRVWLQWLA